MNILKIHNITMHISISPIFTNYLEFYVMFYIYLNFYENFVNETVYTCFLIFRQLHDIVSKVSLFFSY